MSVKRASIEFANMLVDSFLQTVLVGRRTDVGQGCAVGTGRQATWYVYYVRDGVDLCV